LVLNPDSNYTGEIEQDSQLWCSNELAFETINVNDEITISNVERDPPDAQKPPFSITRTVVAVVSNQLLLLDQPFNIFPYENEFFLNKKSAVFVSTPIQSMEFLNGLIENAEARNYIDKLTGLTRRATVEGLDSTDLVTPHQMIQLGDDSYKYGTLSVRGNGIGLGPTDPEVSQAFTITHTFNMGPLSLSSQVNNIKSKVSPPWFLDSNCLKYVFEIEASKDLNNPNDVKIGTEEIELRGNSGNTGENLNTGISRYSVSNVVYTRPDASVIDGIELSENETIVTFFLNNTFNNPFSDGNTRLVFNHWVLHTDPDEYRGPQGFADPANQYPARDRFMKENQLFDRIELTLGGTSTSSDNNGGTDQMIKEVTTVFINSGQIQVIATMKPAFEAVGRITAISNLEYFLSISAANHTLTRAKSDKETAEIDLQPYFVQTTDETMITITNGILLHTGSDVDTDLVQSAVIRPGDDFNLVSILALSRVNIPNYPRADAEIKITSVLTEIIGVKGNDSFVLDSESFNLVSSEIRTLDGHTSVPEMDNSKDRGLSSPVDDLRKFFTVKNRHDLDSAGVFYYEVNTPFVMRWEAWAKLDGAPNDFLDPTAPSNHHKGKNHDWQHYFVATGWTMYAKTTVKATKDGVPQEYKLQSQLLVEDYLQGNEWDTETLQGFKTDATGFEGDEILNGIKSGTKGNELTLIRAEKTYLDPPHTAPALSDLVMVFLVSVFEEGNFKAAFLISSLYDKTGNNPWIGLNGILKTTKTNNGLIYRAEVILQEGFFSSGQELRIACRFYDKRLESGVPNGKRMSDTGVLKKLSGLGTGKYLSS